MGQISTSTTGRQGILPNSSFHPGLEQCFTSIPAAAISTCDIPLSIEKQIKTFLSS